MANLGDRRLSGNRIAEKFVPASDWTQDAKGNYLYLDVPGFKKEQLRIEIASTGHIIISGERTANENKSIYFEQKFALPENSDIDNISGKFDGDFLHVTVPRKSVVEEKKQQESGNENHGNSIGETSVQEEPNSHGENQTEHEQGHGNGGLPEQRGDNEKGEITSKETCRVASFPKEMIMKWEQEDGPFELAMKFLKKNKGAVISVVIAFSIGFLVCRKFESSG